ncbi:hypothetical protein [Halosimplex amylolyticum]|uniref:hypothetical protein n=1 Tax=Halosimplex amylolyticum TaxID=3396616 RepID=UPI003F554391
MQLQQTDSGTKRDAITGGARMLARELIREPVKEAVKEALREEADVRAAQEDQGSPTVARVEDRTDDDGGSGGSSLGITLLGLAAVAGAVYLMRKRGGETEQSTWSEFDDQHTSGTESSEYGRESDASESTGTAAGESSASTSME